MANIARPTPSQRNLGWLLAIVAIAVAVGLTTGWIAAAVAAAVVLAISEVVERVVRSRRHPVAAPADV
jgi:uncharacterized protein involved in cysteine biosynthesis